MTLLRLKIDLRVAPSMYLQWQLCCTLCYIYLFTYVFFMIVLPEENIVIAYSISCLAKGRPILYIQGVTFLSILTALFSVENIHCFKAQSTVVHYLNCCLFNEQSMAICQKGLEKYFSRCDTFPNTTSVICKSFFSSATTFTLLNTPGLILRVQHLKKEGACFKVSKVVRIFNVHLKSQNFVIVSFKLNVSNYQYVYSLICSRTVSYFHYFYVCVLAPYAF